MCLTFKLSLTNLFTTKKKKVSDETVSDWYRPRKRLEVRGVFGLFLSGGGGGGSVASTLLVYTSTHVYRTLLPRIS